MRLFQIGIRGSAKNDQTSFFVTDLRNKFNALQSQKNSFGSIVVKVLPHETVERYDYQINKVQKGAKLSSAIEALKDSESPIVIALDLKKSFEEQWPEHLNSLQNPNELRENPVINIDLEDEIEEPPAKKLPRYGPTNPRFRLPRGANDL